MAKISGHGEWRSHYCGCIKHNKRITHSMNFSDFIEKTWLCLTTIVTFILKKDGHLLCLCNQSFICDIRSCFTFYNLQWNKWQDFFLHIFAKYMYSYYDFYKKIILHFEKPSILVGCLTINVKIDCTDITNDRLFLKWK
jgi:hypothetical protein